MVDPGFENLGNVHDCSLSSDWVVWSPLKKGASSSDHSTLGLHRPNQQQQSSTAAAVCQRQQSTVAAAPHEDLQKSRISDPYRRRRRGAVIAFRMFCDMVGLSILELAHAIDALNAPLINYIQRKYNRKRPISVSRLAILGLQHCFRSLRGRLRPAWDSVSSWQLKQVVRSCIPMRGCGLECFFILAIIYALAFDRRNARRWIAFAIMLRGACFGTLRREGCCPRLSDSGPSLRRCDEMVPLERGSA